jgi:hypothetical protein
VTRATTTLVLLLTVQGALWTAGCLPTVGTRRPDFVQPTTTGGRGNSPPGFTRDGAYERHVYERCESVDGDELHTRAFAATLAALEGSAAKVDQPNFRQKYLEAEICFEDDQCTTVLFQADLAGRVTVSYHKGFTPREFEDDVAHWIVELERRFAEFRCHSDEQLDEVLERHGFEL